MIDVLMYIEDGEPINTKLPCIHNTGEKIDFGVRLLLVNGVMFEPNHEHVSVFCSDNHQGNKRKFFSEKLEDEFNESNLDGLDCFGITYEIEGNAITFYAEVDEMKKIVRVGG